MDETGPDVCRRVGVIEGFYGRPWSWAARKSMVEHLGALGLGVYVHAPKNDPKHRDRWWEPYSRDELREFEGLVGAGREAGVDVSVALAPQKLLGKRNIGAARDGDDDGVDDRAMGALCAKLTALADVGVRSFALLFDDTLATFFPPAATRRSGRLHARVADGVLRRLDASFTGVSLLVVPSVYFGRWSEMSPFGRAYWHGLATVSPRVALAWTGPKIFSPSIRGRDVRELWAAHRRRVVVWNNAVANDWLPLATGGVLGMNGVQKLSFGPPENMDPEVLPAAAGVLLNGAREAELTKIAIACVAQFVRDPIRYAPERAHRRAMEELFGARAARALGEIHALTCRHALAASHRREGHALAAAVARARGDADALRGVAEGLLDATSTLRDALAPGHAVWGELSPTVEKVELTARAALASLGGRPLARRDYLARARRIRWQVAVGPLEGV